MNSGDDGRNPRLDLEGFIRSNELRELRELLQDLPAFRPLLEKLIQIRLIIDADIIQGELRWRLAKRRSPGATSGLLESIAAGVIVPFAPEFLKAEIQEHLEEIAQETGTTIDRAIGEWTELQGHIHFYSPVASQAPKGEVVDVDDLPYRQTYEELAATAVYSKDAHFREMNVPVISVSLDLTLRKHARSGSIFVHVTFGATFSGAIAFGVLKGLLEFARAAVRMFRRLSPALQAAIVAVPVGLLLYPKTRAKINAFISKLAEEARALKPIVLPIILEFADQFFSAVTQVDETRKEIEAALPLASAKKRSAIMHARAICLMSDEPLSVADIESRMRNDGYVTRNAKFVGYLRRLLRTSGQFVETSPGMWRLLTS